MTTTEPEAISPGTATARFFVQVAIPSPLRSLFHYLPPKESCLSQLIPGVRVEVPFGRRKVVGVIVAIDRHCPVAEDKLKSVITLLDDLPVIQQPILALCRWTAHYYHYSLGETLSQALPKALRQGKATPSQTTTFWQLAAPVTESIKASLKRSHRQLEALCLLDNAEGEGLSESHLLESGINKTILRNLADKQLIACTEAITTARHFTQFTPICREPSLTLNHEQQFALDNILTHQNAFHPVLLDGITGSGKTEVYLQAIEACLKIKKQTLVLIPEIGLTPQTVNRFKKRFNTPVFSLHSGLSDGERLEGWQQAASKSAGIIIATRSGIFTPLPSLGLIIVDEEHDASYKQQDTLRYNARDLAIYRASQAKCPVILGSATPSLETYYNAISGRFGHLFLKKRAGQAAPPHMELIDLRQHSLKDGLSRDLLAQITVHLNKGNQVMVFLNRRGYAPSVICHECGTVIDCPHCDAHMTIHRQPPYMHCHHCDHKTAIPSHCPSCQSPNIQPAGQGTERTEQALTKLFPGYPVIRVDRDTTRKKHALAEMLKTINAGTPCILLGTQMLAKGHHFPSVTLVAILNADSGLFSADFRGLERTGQLTVQVAGRAGRSNKPGHVIIQSYNPEHPALQILANNNYTHFAEMLLKERTKLSLPPLTYLALIRTEATHTNDCERLLQQLRQVLEQVPTDPPIKLLGPIPAPMEKRQGRFRWQLMIQSSRRSMLHKVINHASYFLEQAKISRTVRWSIDIDPQDMN